MNWQLYMEMHKHVKNFTTYAGEKWSGVSLTFPKWLIINTAVIYSLSDSS